LPTAPHLHPLQRRTPPRQQPNLAEIDFLTAAEVADLLRVSKMTVYRLIHSKELTAVKVGHNYRVPVNFVRDYVLGKLEIPEAQRDAVWAALIQQSARRIAADTNAVDLTIPSPTATPSHPGRRASDLYRGDR